MKKFYEVEMIFKGHKTKNTFEALDRNNAISIAKSKNPYGVILKVVETSIPMEQRIAEFKRNLNNGLLKGSVKIENLIASIRQLSVMTDAGIPIHDSVREVAKSTEDKILKEIFIKMDDDLNAGMSLTSSAMAFKNELGDVSIAMIELGENTGNMADSLKKLSDILEEVNNNKKKFKKAIRYPIIVLVAIVLAFSVLMVYVVPKFREIFEQLDAELPLPTIILLGMESLVNNYGVYILVAFIFGMFATKYSYGHNPEFKSKCDKFILKIFLIKDIVFYSTMNRFTLVLAELIKAGIPIVDALDTALLTVGNDEIRTKLSFVRVSVQRGVTLTEAIKETGLFESMLIQMIHAGEQSGTLDHMLGKVTLYYKSKFDAIIDNISSYVEPILLVFIAIIVTLMALGIFMPMWDMGRAVKG